MKVKNTIVLLLFPLMLCAQGQGLQVGLQGGVGAWQSDEALGTWTPEAGIDLRYIARWRVATYTQLGLHIGAGATYSTYRLQGDYTSQFTRHDYLGNTIYYTTSASASEQHQAIGVSVPVLFALQTHGFALNIGPRLLWIAYDHYQQTIDNAHIDAYYPAYKVHVADQPSTGRLSTPYTQSGTGPLTSIHLLLSAEIGYEWQIGNPYHRFKEQYIGLQLYANYGVWNWTEHSDAPFLSVSAITGASGSPEITAQSIASASSALTNLSIGLRLYYTIQTVDYPGRGWHRITNKNGLVLLQ